MTEDMRLRVVTCPQCGREHIPGLVGVGPRDIGVTSVRPAPIRIEVRHTYGGIPHGQQPDS